MARKTKAETEATRLALLDAAAKVFNEKGVSGATLEEIAQASGVTRGAVYWHFKNKTDLFQALYDQLYLPFNEMVLQDLEKDHPQPLKQLEELCTSIFLQLTKETHKKRILTVFFLKCDYSGELEVIRQCQNERKANSLKLFTRYFSKAKEKGHLPEEADPRTLSLALLSYFTGITYEYLRNPRVFNLKKNAAQMMRYFFNGAVR